MGYAYIYILHYGTITAGPKHPTKRLWGVGCGLWVVSCGVCGGSGLKE